MKRENVSLCLEQFSTFEFQRKKYHLKALLIKKYFKIENFLIKRTWHEKRGSQDNFYF